MKFYSMIKQPAPPWTKRLHMVFATLFIATFAVWVVLLSQVRVNADSAWLTQAAEHFLNGQNMLEYYFETNPPMSFLIYVPVALLKNLGLQTWNALNLYVIALTILSVCYSFYFLRFWNVPASFKTVFLLGFLIAVTFPGTFDYGQRDHMLGIMMLPFVMGQLSITYNHPVNKRLRLVSLVIASPFILIKPHYGLIPVAMLLHRFYTRKSFRILMDADFVVLSAVTASYIAVIFLFFPEFISVILPASIDLYTSETPLDRPIISKTIVLMLLPVFLSVFIFFAECSKTEKHLLLFFNAVMALYLIPYAVQHKGFYYHLLPFISMVWPVVLTTIFIYIPEWRWPRLQPVFLLFISGLMLLASAWVFNIKTLVHRSYMDSDPIARRVAQTPEGSSFFIEYVSTDAVIHVSEHYNREFASRFPAPWLLPNSDTPSDRKEKYLDLYKKYLFEDFRRYKPELIFLFKDENTLNILTAYQNADEFKDFFQNYDYKGDIQSELFNYSAGEDKGIIKVTFAMYERKSDEPSDKQRGAYVP